MSVPVVYVSTHRKYPQSQYFLDTRKSKGTPCVQYNRFTYTLSLKYDFRIHINPGVREKILFCRCSSKIMNNREGITINNSTCEFLIAMKLGLLTCLGKGHLLQGFSVFCQTHQFSVKGPQNHHLFRKFNSLPLKTLKLVHFYL